MVLGHLLVLSDSLDVSETQAIITSLVKTFSEADSLPPDFEVHVFLPGGLPFSSGTLGDYYAVTSITTFIRSLQS
jgi:hypothetical protein